MPNVSSGAPNDARVLNFSNRMQYDCSHPSNVAELYRMKAPIQLLVLLVMLSYNHLKNRFHAESKGQLEKFPGTHATTWTMYYFAKVLVGPLFCKFRYEKFLAKYFLQF